MVKKYLRKVLDRKSCFMVTLPMPIVGELGIKAGDIMVCALDGRRIAMEVVDMDTVLEGVPGSDRFTEAAREMMRPDGEGEVVVGRPGAGRPKGSKLERLRIK